MKGFTKQHELIEVIAITTDKVEYSELYSIGWSKRGAIEDLMERIEDKHKVSVIYVKEVTKYENNDLHY